MILQTKLAILSAKWAPLAAALIVAGMVQIEVADSASLGKAILTIGVAAFTAMGGVLYWDLRRAIAALSKQQAKSDADTALQFERFAERQQRLVGVMAMMPLIHSSPEERAALVERIRQVLES